MSEFPATSGGVRRALAALIPVLVAVVLMPTSKPAAQAGYTLETLPGPATDVNDSGDVAGQWSGPNGSRGYLWTKDTGAQPMITDGALINRFPCTAPKINANRVIVAQGSGGASCGQVPHRAARYSTGVGLEIASTSQGDNGQAARAVNASGTAVGIASGNNAQPFIWTAGGSLTVPFPFSVPFGAGGSGNGINDDGVMVGHCQGDSFSGCPGPMQHAFWWLNNVRTLLPPVTGSPATAYEALAINNNGQVVGRYSGGGIFGAFLSSIEPNATTVDLLAPTGDVSSIDINDAGDVVATIVPPGGGSVPYLYRNGVWTNINTLRPPGSTLQLQTATAINNLGWIVGDANPTAGTLGYVLIPPPANSAPTANDGALTTSEDTAVSDTLSATDPNDDDLTYTILTDGLHGTAVITDETTGAFTYTPDPNYSGDDEFTFKVNDGTFDSNEATVTVTVMPVNDAPEAIDSLMPAVEDTPSLVTFQATDVDGPALTFSIVTNGTKGTAVVTDEDTGAFTYTPDLNATGLDSVTFQVSDGSLADEGTFTFDIGAVNDAPVASPGSLAVTEDVPATGTFVASDVDSSALTFSIVINGTKGTAVITNTATGAYTYTPNANANGSDTVTFSASDGTLASNVASVDVSIAAVNDAPVASAGVLTVTEDVAATGTFVASDVDSVALTFSIVTNGTKGTAVITNAATGAFTYTPNANASGADGVTFQVTDGALASNVATVAVTITAVNDSPVARSGVVTTPENTPVSGMLLATDAESGLTFSIASPPAQGSVQLTHDATGAFIYTPNPGTTGYDPFTFEVSDGSSSSTGTEMVFVVADAPQWPGQTVLASASVGGTPGNGAAEWPTTSADGRFVAFHSGASNLVSGDTNGTTDVFALDRTTGILARVSVSSTGAQGTADSSFPSVSADGRYVAFRSLAPLVAGDTNARTDVFVHDRQTASTVRVSVSSSGAQSNGPSEPTKGALSADGRYVLFYSDASNLVVGDTNGVGDLFVRDMLLGTTDRVSLAADGSEANGFSGRSAISQDGRFVAFQSAASNLVPGDTNGTWDVFVRDRLTAETRRVSVSAQGVQANGISTDPTISVDGRFVAFWSSASNLVASDTNQSEDVFVHDRASGSLERVSVNGTGQQGNSTSLFPWLSADGRYVAFYSAASNLENGDTNGQFDTFVRDRIGLTTRRISVNGLGEQVAGGTSSQFLHLSADGRFVGFTSAALGLVEDVTDAQQHVYVVGGVSVNPVSHSFRPETGSGTVTVSFAYPGTTWTAISSAPWLTITDQSSTTANGTVAFAVAANASAAPRTGTLTVAAQAVTIMQAGATDPVAQASSILTSEDMSANGTLIANDPNGGALTFSIVSNGSLGTAIVTNPATGAFTYTPNPNANGTDSFTFRANNGSADSNVATVTVTITAVNDPPVATNGTLTTNEDATGSGILSATDIDSPALTYSVVTNGAKGTAVVTNAATGAYTYTPNQNASGGDTFTYEANDSALDSNVATVTISIASVNDAPVAQDGALAVSAGASASGTLAATDVDSPSLTFGLVANGALGTATITNAATGAYSYIANAGTSGTDTFTFRADDGQVDSNVASVTVTITPVNQPPLARTGVLTTTENVAASGTLQGFDPDGDVRTFTLTSMPTLGTVVLGDAATGAFTFTPNAGATGYDTFTYKVDDGQGSATGLQMVFIVASSLQLPGQTTRVSVASDGSEAALGSHRASISANGRYVAFSSWANLAPGDTNGRLDVFVHDRQTGQTRRVSVASDGMQANRDSDFPSLSAGGRYVAFHSLDSGLVVGDTNGTFDVFVHDLLTGETSRVSVASDGTQGNGSSEIASLSADGRYVAFYSSASTLVASDTNGVDDVFVHDRQTGRTTLASSAMDGTPANGFSAHPSLSADGRYVAFYSEASNLVATDTNGTIDVFVHDLQTGETRRVSESTEGTQANGASIRPWISADGRHVAFHSVASNLVASDGNGAIDVFVHDRSTQQTARVSLATGGSEANSVSGNPSVSADGRYVAFFSLATNLVHEDTNAVTDVFVHDRQTGETRRVSVASDGTQGNDWTDTGDVRNLWLSADGQYVAFPSFAANLVTGDMNTEPDIFVVGAALPPSIPVAEDGALLTGEDTPATGTLAASDPGSAPLTYSIVTNGTLGIVTVTNPATGAFTYTPNPNANGTDSFTFKANNGSADSNIATVTVTITAVNDAPLAINGTLTTAEDTPASGTLSATDIDGPALTFSIVTNGTKGVATITNAATGAFTYTPNANTNGSDTVTFQTSDGTLTSNVATVTIAIAAVDDAPIAQNGTLGVAAGGTASGSLVATDIDSSTLTLAIATNSAKGTAAVTNTATGTYTYTANAGTSGTDTFTFQANDGTTNSNVATITVTIVGGNQPPVASGSSLTTLEDKSVSGALVATDPERAKLTFSIVSAPTKGTATITNASTGRFTYVPNANTNGADSFTFRASDGTLTSNIAMVTMTVTPVNDVPTVVNQSLTTQVNQAVSGAVQGTDVDGDTLTYLVSRAPKKGTLTLNAATGAFVYTPNPNFQGNDSFTFRARDAAATSSAGTVSITVSP